MKKFTIIASLVLMMVVGTSSAQAVTSKPRSQAPARAEATNSNMKILTLAEAQAITFTWTDAQGVEHANSIADPATDPRHIVGPCCARSTSTGRCPASRRWATAAPMSQRPIVAQ